MHKVLEDAGVKVASVASKTLTLSGRAMLAALVAGERDPGVLAELALWTDAREDPQLRQALAGRFSDHHAVIVGQMLARIDHADDTVARLSARVAELTTGYARQIELLDTIPGVTSARPRSSWPRSART